MRATAELLLFPFQNISWITYASSSSPVLITFQITSYGQQVQHFDSTTSINLLVALNALNVLGRFLPPLLSLRLGALPTLIPTVLCTSVILFAWIAVPVPAPQSYVITSTPKAPPRPLPPPIGDKAPIFLIAILYGFFAAGLQGLNNAVIVSFVKSAGLRAVARTNGQDVARSGGIDRSKGTTNANDKDAMGMAFVYVLIALGCLTGAPLGGRLVEVNDGEYLYAQIFAGGTVLVGAVLLIAAGVARGGWRGVWFGV